jgi:hypothetical protein
MIGESAVSVADPKAAEVLRKITSGEGLLSDKLIEHLTAAGESGNRVGNGCMQYQRANLGEAGNILLMAEP